MNSKAAEVGSEKKEIVKSPVIEKTQKAMKFKWRLLSIFLSLKCVLNTYYVPDVFLDSKNYLKAVNKADKIPCLYWAYISGEGNSNSQETK